MILYGDSLIGLFASICAERTLAIELCSFHLSVSQYSFCLFITLSLFELIYKLHVETELFRNILMPAFCKTRNRKNGTESLFAAFQRAPFFPLFGKPSSVHLSCWILYSEISDFIDNLPKFQNISVSQIYCKLDIKFLSTGCGLFFIYEIWLCFWFHRKIGTLFKISILQLIF